MRKIILCGALLISTTITFAQSENNGKNSSKESNYSSPQERQAKMAKELSLTEEQQAKLKAVMEKHKINIEEARKIKKADIDSILTTEQKKQIKEREDKRVSKKDIKKDRKEMRAEKRELKKEHKGEYKDKHNAKKDYKEKRDSKRNFKENIDS